MSLMQILSQANQSQSQQHAPPSSATSSTSQIPPPPSLPPPPGLSPAQFILHSSLPLVGCTKTPPSHLHPSIGGGCAQTPPPIMPVGLSGMTGSSGDTGWDNESKDPDKVKLNWTDQGSLLSLRNIPHYCCMLACQCLPRRPIFLNYLSQNNFSVQYYLINYFSMQIRRKSKQIKGPCLLKT